MVCDINNRIDSGGGHIFFVPNYPANGSGQDIYRGSKCSSLDSLFKISGQDNNRETYSEISWEYWWIMKGDYYNFITVLGHRESGNRYDSLNTLGFMGRWQFGKPRLYDLGISIDGWAPKGRPVKKNITRNDFLSNPSLQDVTMYKHIGQLKRLIKSKHSDFLGKEINGVVITLSGLVAGAHLKGMGGVKQFLQGKDNSDAYGTTISEYIGKFADYDLDQIPERKLEKGSIVMAEIPKPKGINKCSM